MGGIHARSQSFDAKSLIVSTRVVKTCIAILEYFRFKLELDIESFFLTGRRN